MRIEGDTTAARPQHAVEVIGVSKSFGSVRAAHDLTLGITQGEVLTLLGPSGCGKTTLLNMIAGFEEPSAGRILIDGIDVTHVPPFQRDTGMVFQSYALFPHMNVYDNVAFGLRMRRLAKAAIAEHVARALAMVKLEGLEGRRVRQLSGGQQQRVALARAIVIRPKVLLLDEPLSALDRNLRAQMQIELRELHERTGLTTVFVTHDQGEALSLSDRIVVMNRGEIQQIATPLELYRHPANSFVACFIGDINRLPPARCRRNGSQAAFEFPGSGPLSTARRADLDAQEGALVHLFVRPEAIRPARSGESEANLVRCRVITHVYQGNHTIVRLDAGALGQLEMRVLGGDILTRAPAGAELDVVIELDQAVSLADQ
jgi:putative spermidine/putrescine transport system ATP-binding protein